MKLVGRGEMTDKAWKQIAPLLPENGRHGGQWGEHREVLDGREWGKSTTSYSRY